MRTNSRGTDYNPGRNFGTGLGSVTSVGLSMPPRFTVTNAPVTSNGVLTVTDAGQVINPQTGTSYTLALVDDQALVTLSNALSITVTIPLNATIAFKIGAVIFLTQLGAGVVTVAVAGGGTLRSLAAKVAISGQYGVARLEKIATDVWLLSGDLA